MDATPFEISATHCHAMWNKEDTYHVVYSLGV
jgi:hypothetical protein